MVQPSGAQADNMLEAFHQLQEDYAQLQEKYYMMEHAARAEISELRTRLLDAHRELAEVGIARAVSGCAEKIVVRHAIEEEVHASNQNLLVARAELTRDFEMRLWRARRFGPPEQLVRRIMNCRLEWLQLQCLSVWRALVLLRPEPQNLQELEVEIRCWEKARRLRVAAFNARRMFSAWRRLADQQERVRLRMLVDLAHDSWEVLHISVHRAVNQHFYIRASAAASRCFLEWLWRYRTSRRLARFWRRFGKERRRRLTQWCFTCFLRAVLVAQKDRIQMCEKVSAAGLPPVAKSTVNMALRFLEKHPPRAPSLLHHGVVV